MPAHGTVQCPIVDCTHPACVSARAAEALLPHFTCTRCNVSLPESRFSARQVRGVARRQSWCRECAASHARQARANGTATRARTSARLADSGAFERQFGVEIETEGASVDSITREFRRVGLTIRYFGYTHEVQTSWKIVTDSSLRDGLEVVSPILKGAAGRRELRLAMQALQAAGATVSRRCGLHVHHDVQDLTAGGIFRLVKQWQESQAVTSGLVAPSRRGVNTYCSALTADDVHYAQRWADQHGHDTAVPYAQGGPRLDRFKSLNITSYGLYGTVEIRQHQGTLNAAKALAWVSFGQAMIERAKQGDATAPSTIRELLASCEEHGLDSGTAAYLEDRHVAFAGGRAEV